MDKNITAKSATERFIKRVTVVSLAILLFSINLAIFVYSNMDNIKTSLVEYHIASGNYDKAIEISESISDSDIRNLGKYRVAKTLYNESSYTDAANLFTDLEGYRDSEKYYLKCSYANALVLFDKGSYDEALEAFTALGNYSDSKEKVLEIRYTMAKIALEEGEHSRAIMLFLALGDYSNSSQMAYDAALALTGDEDIAKEMIYSGGMTPDELAVSLNAAERRSLFPDGVLAAGAKHTVLLHKDGTVSACGDNTYGQCDVSDWTDIIYISAGAYHTVGLRKDGTVVAVGKNDYGQCNTSDWSDITAIAAADTDTYGVTSSGKIKFCGYHEYDNIKRASDVSDVYAGSYAAVVKLTTDSYIASHKTYSLKTEQEIVGVGLDTGYIVALSTNGKCISNLEKISQWDSIAYISCGPNAVIGIKVDGTVVSHFFRSSDAIDFSSLTDICKCAVGTKHVAFLSESGNVIAYGDNSSGQCDTDTLGNY